jgi:hypothetical protein
MPNVDKLKTDLTQVLKDELEHVLNGAPEDIANIAVQLTELGAEAAAVGDMQSIEDLRKTVITLAEDLKLHAINGQWHLVGSFVVVLLRSAMAGVAAG